jgi:voltage-gated potassium channel
MAVKTAKGSGIFFLLLKMKWKLTLLALYVVLVLTYSFVYFALRDNFSGIKSYIDALYFSMTVMSTTGFGDILPVTELAKAILLTHMSSIILLAGILVL